jgi:hypothetical protein
MFTPRTLATDVPSVGSGHESATIDMKGGPDAYRQLHSGVASWKSYEMAKDVAAFANAMGGTVLVGAEEDRAAGVCSAHSPFSDARATELTEAISTAIEKRCRPRLPRDGARRGACRGSPWPRRRPPRGT